MKLSLKQMLGLGYAYLNSSDLIKTWAGLKPERPPLLLDIPGAWLAGLVGESPGLYYSDPCVQLNLRRRAEQILFEASGLRLSNCMDFGGISAGSIFGGKVVFPEDAPPHLLPAISSPYDVTKLAAHVDALAIEEAGLAPRLFEWRHQLRQRENVKPGFVLRIPGLVTLAEQVCGAENLYNWIDSHPGRIMDLAGVLRRTLIRLVNFIKRRTGAPTPMLIIDDPKMAKVDVEVFHEIFWRSTRSVALALTSRSLFRCFRAQGCNEDQLKLIARLGCGIVQPGASLDLKNVKSIVGKAVVWGGPEPDLLRDGDPERILVESRDYIDRARSAGLSLFFSIAGAVQYGTPVENITALAKASERKYATCWICKTW